MRQLIDDNGNSHKVEPVGEEYRTTVLGFHRNVTDKLTRYRVIPSKHGQTYTTNTGYWQVNNSLMVREDGSVISGNQ